MISALSKNGVRIRLTDERWNHIIEDHDELINKRSEVFLTIKQPDIIVEGYLGEHIAARQKNGRWYIVVYREIDKNDGFVITSFIISRIGYILNKKIIWKKE